MARRTSSRQLSKSGVHPNYPRRGTPAGEVLLGTCDGFGCGREIRRGDPFVATLSKHLVCRDCWAKPVGEWLSGSTILEKTPVGEPIQVEIFENGAGAAAPEPEPVAEEPALVVAEDYGPDNPFF